MKFMKIIAGAACASIVAIALTFSGTLALAQQKPSAASIEIAKKIVAAKGGTAMFEALIPGVIVQARSMFEQQNPALGKDLREVGAQLNVEFAKRMDELNTEVAKFFAERFTESELKEILAFYTSPLGKKMVLEEPKAIDESMQFAQTWSRKLSDEIVSKMRAEMKKRGHDI